MYEDGQQLRDYVHIEDVVSANILTLESEKANYESFNVGGSSMMTVMDFTRMLIKVLGKNFEPACPGEFRYGDTRHIISDIAKLKNIGWKPKHQVIDNITDYVNWVRAQPEVSDFYTEAERVMRQQGVIQNVK